MCAAFSFFFFFLTLSPQTQTADHLKCCHSCQSSLCVCLKYLASAGKIMTPVNSSTQTLHTATPEQETSSDAQTLSERGVRVRGRGEERAMLKRRWRTQRKVFFLAHIQMQRSSFPSSLLHTLQAGSGPLRGGGQPVTLPGGLCNRTYFNFSSHEMHSLFIGDVDPPGSGSDKTLICWVGRVGCRVSSCYWPAGWSGSRVPVLFEQFLLGRLCKGQTGRLKTKYWNIIE